MATGKRFYWMKLKESFMTSDTIDYFMSQPDGANYVVLYHMFPAAFITELAAASSSGVQSLLMLNNPPQYIRPLRCNMLRRSLFP